MGRLLDDPSGELDRLYDALSEANTKFAEVAIDAANARADYKLEFTKAFFEATGSLGSRERAADLAAAGLYRRKEVAEALEKSQRLLIDSIGEAMGACRTQVASTRNV
jgi:hypothetical protein